MNCIVTAGPTFEPLDDVRRLINFSTGRLGSELANFLAGCGHEVTLLIGQHATWRGECQAQQSFTFGTTSDLHARLQSLAANGIDAVFHAAAVSDFTFGRIWRQADGELEEIDAGKISSRAGSLLAELRPTAKIISQLRGWFPDAWLAGWKYEVDQDRAHAVTQAEEQIASSRTNACVANGPAYGRGFGLVTGSGRCLHLDHAAELFSALEELMRQSRDQRAGSSATV